MAKDKGKVEKPVRSQYSNNKITLGRNPKNKKTSIGNSRNSRPRSKNDKLQKGKG